MKERDRINKAESPEYLNKLFDFYMRGVIEKEDIEHEFTFEKMPNENIMLYAKWAEIPTESNGLVWAAAGVGGAGALSFGVLQILKRRRRLL